MSISNAIAIQLEGVGSDLKGSEQPKVQFLQNIRCFAAWSAGHCGRLARAS
ncbi:hypothetical protein P3T43_006622 [Paraburkholderia sp. GAS41]|jgi:hypothetical protein